jgi:hypothetical protein
MQALGVADDVSMPLWNRDGHANEGIAITPRLMQPSPHASVEQTGALFFAERYSFLLNHALAC